MAVKGPNVAGAIDPNTGKPSTVDVLDKTKIAKEAAPSTAAATTWINWADAETTLGQPFASAIIPISRLYEMRRDPMIAFALWFIKVPLVRSPWYIDCADAQVAAFIDGALRRIFGRFILQWGNCLDFGYSPLIKRFELDFPDWTWTDPTNPNATPQLAWPSTGNVAAVVWKPFVAVPPQMAAPIWDANGDFNGFHWTQVALPRTTVPFVPGKPTQTASNSTADKQGTAGTVDVAHALWCTNEKDSVFGSLYGYPRIGYAFRMWWSYWFRWAIADRAFERHIDPATIVYFPEEKVIDMDGAEQNPRDIALDIATRLRSGVSAALPSTRQETSDGKMGDREWAWEQLKADTDFQALQETFTYLDTMKLRSCLVPEQALIEGTGGTSSRNVAEEMADMFYESQAVLMAEIADHINRFMIPQLVQANFPDKVKAGKGTLDCRFVSRGFSATDMQLARQLVQLIGQTDPSLLGVDVRSILQQLSIPVMHPDAQTSIVGQGLLGQLNQAGAGPGAAQPTLAQPPGSGVQPQQLTGNPAQKGSPSPANAGAALAAGELAQALTQPGPGYIRGVTDEGGHYVTQRERIVLSTDSFPRRLKNIVRTDADEAMNIAAEIRDLWEATFRDIYKVMADTVRGARREDLVLDEDADELDLADSIIDRALRRIRALVSRAAGRTQSARKRLVQIVGQRALRDKNVHPTIPFSADSEEAMRWMAEQGGFLISSLDESLRNEMRAFLAGAIASGDSVEQIAEGIAVHFKDWPGWKAQRLARTEVARAYNEAVLLAAEHAGLTHVRVHDASRGTNLETDTECIQRNGDVVQIAEARQMLEDTHPNCTIGFDVEPQAHAPAIVA